MPNHDRTGPAGQGPMTGGQRGLCGGKRTAEPVPEVRTFEQPEAPESSAASGLLEGAPGTAETADSELGVGRGGAPRGGGQGHCYGGGRNRGQGTGKRGRSGRGGGRRSS